MPRLSLNHREREVPVTEPVQERDMPFFTYGRDSWSSVDTGIEDEPIYDEPTDSMPSLTWRGDDMPSYASASDFPAYELPRWDINERETVANVWSRQMDYRLRWIFYREEREGVSRTRYINPFSPEDFKHRIEKTTEPHHANTPTSTFYDWKIGGSEFLMRLESLKVEDNQCLRCHFIHRPSGKEICYQDRIWDGNVYSEVNMVWADSNPS